MARRNKNGLPDRAVSRADGTESYSRLRKRRGRRKVLKRFLIAILILILTATGAGALWLKNIDLKLTAGLDEDVNNQLTTTAPDEPFYMLLLGVDKDQERAEMWGSSDANYRSDTIILARVDPQSKKVTLVSIPRDTMVTIDGYGTQKINAAYALGGPSLAIDTVSDFAGVPISHYAELDFNQLQAIVDAVGGVDVNLPVAVKDVEYAMIDLPAGQQTLAGWQAVGLCRSRHAYDAYGGGDFFRAANQRMVIAAILKKILALDPVTMTNTISTLADGVRTDLTTTDIISLAMQFRGLDVENDIYSGQTPTVSEMVDGLWYEMPSTEAWKTMMERVDQGLTPYSNADQDFTAGVAGSIGGGNYDSDDSSSSSSSSSSSAFDLASLSPASSGSVLTLNASGVAGIAGSTAETLSDGGFDVEADNADDYVDSTTIYYNNGAEGAAVALGVAQRLGLDSSCVKPNDGDVSSLYDAVVVIGTDY